MARPLAGRLLDYYRPAHPSLEIKHLHEFYRASTCDSVWVPKISGQGWIVITKDGGKDSSKPRLPEVCKRSKITYVVLSPKLGHQKVIIHQEALDEVMRNIAAIYQAPPGTGIKLERRVSKGGIKSYGLSVKVGKVWQSLGSFLTALG